MTIQNERVLLHLRKSRADLEAEARGEGETLAKHEAYLLKYAGEKGLNIVEIRREVESGEHLSHRPKMMETLREVEAGLYSAVLCMDVDRLGRGNKQDQGIILETFKKSKTKIITPRKVYDLCNEWDEDFFDFEQFMAAKELKYITRRMQRGRRASVESGNFINPIPPYGYTITIIDRSRILTPHSEQAAVVRMIFNIYTREDLSERMGSSKIANYLNDMGYPSATGKLWSSARVSDIIRNPTYAGFMRWGKKDKRKSTKPGFKTESTQRKDDEIVFVVGKHEPLVTVERFRIAQELIGKKHHPPYHLINGITNPLAGLVKCGLCGKTMVSAQGKRDQYMKCRTRGCQTKAAKTRYVEEKVMDALSKWLAEYEVKLKQQSETAKRSKQVDFLEKTLDKLNKEHNLLLKQKSSLHDLLEQGIYTKEDFLERSRVLLDKLEESRARIEKLTSQLEQDRSKVSLPKDIVPEARRAIDIYCSSADATKKNELLKLLLDYVVYNKSKSQHEDDFELKIFPKFPQEKAYSSVSSYT
ncbi:recombinase [Desulfosporosinus acididurans]|uniref:Recombinase n=1 Tax=Desulfosporosinus acididurans TaxID=476652 RepID=A0A0J1FTM9_9FIRM|nr:recombinase family protein [Desulfosporosinus acididurans]KLU66348.1 recombinase [Desulfosporosinus acididurans]